MNVILSRNKVSAVCLLIALSSTLLFAQNQDMVTDSSAEFLQGTGGDVIATAVPTIDFGIVDVGSAPGEFTHWCNIVLGPDNRYYFGVGDHNSDGVVMLMCYDPATKVDSTCIDSRDIPGLKDGKWHGRPVINPNNGDMYLIGFYNGDIVHYNIYSKVVEHLGQPVPNTGFEEHIWDWRRELLYGIGMGGFLVYDTQNRSVVFQGKPKDSQTGASMTWDYRARLLDPETGYLYGTELTNDNIIRYEPETNSFTKMQSRVQNYLRASTNIPEKNGSFWIFSCDGTLFKFFPEDDRIEYKGENWDNGRYATFIERSPGGRYLYYAFAGASAGMPVVQYDTKTEQLKVIAFLGDFYSNNYHFTPRHIYGGALSADGSSVFLVCNNRGGNPGMFHVHIPESERADDNAIDVISPQTAHPNEFALYKNYPNPFNPTTQIGYQLSEPGQVSLRIFDLHGCEVATLVAEYQAASYHTQQWNGTNNSGSAVAGGIYFYQLQAGSFVKTHRMLLIK